MKWSRILLFLFALGLSEARALDSFCYSQQVRIIQRPLHQGGVEGHWVYRFHLNVSPEDEESALASSPTVIFIPGGPGQTSMQMPLSYPSHFRVIRTDPRGLGCNQDSRLQEVTSLRIAEDIAAIVQSLNLKNYFIHGISYGTLVAALTLAEIEGQGLEPPKAVILEGVLGRAFHEGEYAREYLRRWQELQQRLHPQILAQLQQDSPLQVGDKLWGNFISTFLLFGEQPQQPAPLVEHLEALMGSESDQAWLRNFIKNLGKPADPMRVFYHRQITCREIAPDMRDIQFDFSFLEGQLQLRPPTDYCLGQAPVRLYDSKKLSLRSPVFLFSGTLDPATPPEQAEYFFENQNLAPLTLIQIQNGGHAALSNSLAECAEDFWQALTISRQRARQQVADCANDRVRLQVNLQVKNEAF